MALLNVAIADATIAAWDSKYAHNRPRPAEVRPALTTVIPTPASPAYPAEHAVTAGAAAAVLGFLFPEEAATFAALAEEAGTPACWPAPTTPAMSRPALELGQQVAKLVIERAQNDGSDAEWAGSVPTIPASGTAPSPSSHWLALG